MRNAEFVTGEEKRTARWKKHRALHSTTKGQRILLMDKDRQATALYSTTNAQRR